MQFFQSRSLPLAAFAALALAGLSFAPVLNAQVLTVPTQTAQKPASAAAQPQNPDAQIDPRAEAKVIASLEARNFDTAFTGASAILAANPDSPKANKLVGVVLLDQQKPSEALSYFQKALQLAPSDPTVHGLLLQAYAQSGDKVHRDEQRVILRGYHSDGKHPGFAQIPSFLIETIPVGDKTVQATEYYEPFGQFHFYYRFNIFDAGEHFQGFIALESDDADQPLYAKAHPKQAAAGERRFSIDGYSKSADGHVTQALYTFYDGQPGYDVVRDLVVKLVQEGKSPVSAPAPAASK
ncbi:MAG: tetratricopeptide repeat protein [Silvibacterium sp.]